MTSDCPPQSMPLLEERLRSRFEWGLIVDIQPPDFETRLAILRSKVDRSGSSVDVDVLEFIAQQTHGNIRVLEGYLNRVVAFSQLTGESPTVETAATALKDIANRQPREDTITPDLILCTVADSFNLDKNELLGRRRDKDTALARRLAMYLIRQETNYSLAQIGHEIGNRDAATVTTACKKITGDIDGSHFLKRKLRDIERNLHPKTASNNGH